MSSRGFTPPDDEGIELNEGEHTVKEYKDGELVGEGGEPDTKDDEFARDDAPEQEWENDA
jgi:hypothetical protein